MWVVLSFMFGDVCGGGRRSAGGMKFEKTIKVWWGMD